MESSRFIQLTPQILIEYIYTDEAAPSTFNTSAYPIEIMRDAYTSGSYLFNTDVVASTMGNYRDISVASINANLTEYAFLNTSVGVPYNDFDANLTDSDELLQTFSPNLDIEYDRIKVHFVAGFTFENYDGLIFEILVNRRDDIELNLSSINFLKSDTPIFNPDPLLLADKLYSTYIEWRVPSLFFMNNNFSSGDSNGLGYRLTQGTGFEGRPPIGIRVSGISKTTVDNGYDYYSVNEVNSASIPNRDIYDSLSASVVESSNGDYFELTGLVAGSSLSNFIATLNSEGGNYIVFHEISLTEQIGSNFIQTSNQIITQTSDFDEPILFRPIVLNSANAVSFAINYVLRLYNQNDNTQIIKNARLVSFDVKKYGRRLMKINLGTVPTVANVVNQINRDDGQNIVISDGGFTNADSTEKITEKLVVKTNYVTSFRDRLNIKVTATPIKIQTITDVD